MKIIHVIPCLKNGGVEAAAISSLNHMNKRNSFTLVAIEPALEKVKIKNTLTLNFSIVNPVLYIKFLKLVFVEKPDVLIFSLWKSSLLGIVILPFVRFFNKKTNTAIIIHNARYAHAVDRIVTKVAIRLFDQVFCDSQSTQDFTMKNSRIKPEIISFILRRNTVKPNDFKSDILRFVFVGRLNTVKNIDLAIDFIKELHQLGLNVRFDIYGPDEGMLEQCKVKIDSYNLRGKVIFKGVIDNIKVPEILKSYDFYLQLSKVEGMAMSVVEAMQIGLVPCVTNVGQIEHYASHLKNAIVFDVNKLHDVGYLAEMAKLIFEISSDPVSYFRLSSNAAKSFSDELIYAEDLEKKIDNFKK